MAVILTDKEKQYIKDLHKINELKKQMKDIEDAMWEKVNLLKKSSDKLKWKKIQDEKKKYRNTIAPLKEELSQYEHVF
jgi:hypothetical protein